MTLNPLAHSESTTAGNPLWIKHLLKQTVYISYGTNLKEVDIPGF